MKCNNKYCLWSAFDQCCPESKDLFDKATPNKLDCPSSLRSDFDNQLYLLVDECGELLNRRNFKQLIEIKKFIENQK